MKELKLELDNGVNTLESFNISVEEWMRIIQDLSLFDPKSLEIIKRWYYEDNHLSSSNIISAKYFLELSETLKSIVIELCRKILKSFDYDIEEEDELDDSWAILFDGYRNDDRLFWKLKDNVCKALEDLSLVNISIFKKPRVWVFPCDTAYYNVYGAFENLKELYWRQHLKEIKVGDKVFIYVGKPESKLSFYCEVLEINANETQAQSIDDSVYYLKKLNVKTPPSTFTRLKLLKLIYDDRFKLAILNNHGINDVIKGQRELTGEGLTFVLHSLNYNYLDIDNIEEKLEIYKSYYLKEDQKKFKKGQDELRTFNDKFPISKINDMKLSDYCLGMGNNTNFSYFLESRLKFTGSIRGGSSHKFGVFYSTKNKKYVVTRKWSKKLDENEAFENIKASIKEVIEAGSNYDLVKLENNKLANVVKGKILASYFPEKYIGIFSGEDLDHFFLLLGVPFNSKLSTIRKQYQMLKLKEKNKVFDSLTFDEFMSFLYKMYGEDLKEVKKMTIRRAERAKERKSASEVVEEDLGTGMKELVIEEFDFITNDNRPRIPRKTPPPNYAHIQEKKDAVGKAGELLVLEYETERLKNSGSLLTPEKISESDSSAGYDILSYENNGTKKYIEVKTRKAKMNSSLDFFITSNEYEKFNTLEGYVIYFISDLNSNTPRLRIITKDMYGKFEPVPVVYRIRANIRVTR